jgi:uncharacterized membrane protein YqaE (UPF0057 family)
VGIVLRLLLAVLLLLAFFISGVVHAIPSKARSEADRPVE